MTITCKHNLFIYLIWKILILDFSADLESETPASEGGGGDSADSISSSRREHGFINNTEEKIMSVCLGMSNNNWKQL